MEPALAILELSSIARAVLVNDAIVKRAPVSLLWSRPVSTGKHVIAFAGGVAEVGESFGAGREVAAGTLIDALMLPYAHEQLVPLVGAAAAPPPPRVDDSVAIVETRTVCATVHGADAAAKAADVILLEMRLAVGIGGKGYFTMTGELHSIEAAVEAARDIIQQRLIAIEVIPAPHEDIKDRLIF